MHTGNETISRIFRRPRLNIINRDNVMEVWGDKGEREIEIPGVIDDYNFNMLGVEKSDQLIAYYRTNVRCSRYWMALMFHCLDIIRIIHKSYVLMMKG